MTTQEEVSYQVASKVPKSTYMKIKRLVDQGLFLNFSEFTRKAIEDELEMLGETEIVSVREASVEEAKKMIERYLDEHRGSVYPSDIADHYGLELETVFEAVKQLMAKGRIKGAESE
jgi:Arc/MetJ-type ribon-helix-helix transcriptional regulator